MEILQQVADQLKNSSPLVKDRLVNVLVEKELNSRVELLDKSLTKLKETKKALDKIKPDTETFSKEGVPQEPVFSKAKYEERKKTLELVEKLEKAIEKALSGEGFDKLKELGGKSE